MLWAMVWVCPSPNNSHIVEGTKNGPTKPVMIVIVPIGSMYGIYIYLHSVVLIVKYGKYRSIWFLRSLPRNLEGR